MADTHEMVVLMSFPSGSKLVHCPQCGRKQMICIDPFGAAILNPGNDTVKHRFADESVEIVSVVLDDLDPNDLSKFFDAPEQQKNSLAYSLFRGAGIGGCVIG